MRSGVRRVGWAWRPLAALALLSLVAGCGRFARSDTQVDTVNDPDIVPIDSPETTKAAAGTPLQTSPPAAPTTVELSPPPTSEVSPPTAVTSRTAAASGAANRSIVDHPGWRVTLTVGDRAEFGVADTVPIEVALQNTNDRDRHHEVDQPDSVVIARTDDVDRAVWTHRACNPTLTVYEQPGGLRALAPRETTRMIVRYPISDECRLPAGDYIVFGQWSVCPDDARRETANPGTFVCEEGRAELVDAGPVPLRLR